MTQNRILSATEKRSVSIYKRFWHLHFQRDVHELIESTQLDLPQKFTATLAAFAHLKFPLTLSDFRSLIPDAFWSAHVRFQFSRIHTGPTPIFCGQGEMSYNLLFEPRTPHASRYGMYGVVFCASSSLSAGEESPNTDWHPPLNAAISRYTLCHPLLQEELHDPSGIYVFTWP